MSIKISKCKEPCTICGGSHDRETYNIEDDVKICNECTRSLIKYYNENALNPTVYKYTLSLQMYTDDDCQINYKGKKYCFYGEDLDVRLHGDTLQELVSALAEVKVELGGKASECTAEWLYGLRNAILDGTTGDYPEVNSNQVYTFNFYKNKQQGTL